MAIARNNFEKRTHLGHLMLDLETMGNGSFAAVVSIGAVEFDIETGKTGREFYKRVDLQSCLDAGLIVNGCTIYWWLLQNETARQEIAKGGTLLKQALSDFADFMNNFDENLQIWGNGVRFDVGILEDAYVACKMDRCWNFRKERDVRTLVSFREDVKANYPLSGIEHNPIDDCKYQIGYCTKIFNTLNTK